MHIESYATVHQLVSTICGIDERGLARSHRRPLRPKEHDALSAAAAAFHRPAPNLSRPPPPRPKARTMRIIDEREMSVPRGAYSRVRRLGSVFSVGSACDLNVIIRTAVIDERGSSPLLRAEPSSPSPTQGMSTPEEVLLKLRPVMRAVAVRASSTRR